MNPEQHENRQQAPSDQQAKHPHRRASGQVAIGGLFVLLIIAAVVAVVGITSRLHSRAELEVHTNSLAAPTVQVRRPATGSAVSEIVLPGNVYAYTDSPIYARTDGYLEKWYFDIGAHVRKGQLLATISSPEVDQQLLQARADLANAEAAAALAKTNATRYQDLLAQNAVSRQDTDTFTTQQTSTSAAVRSAQANVQRLEELQSFEKIYAPFDGVITARSVDIGQLISAGTGQQMFHLAAVQTLRVYVNVPQAYSRGATVGMPAELTFSEFPGEKFPGKLVRTSRAIDPSSRTLLVEVDVNNHDGKLVPGAYAQVHMNLDSQVPSFIVPVSALIFRSQGLQIATVVQDTQNQNVAKLIPVTLGSDDGKTVQIISGLNADSQVVQNPPDSLIDGEPVQVVPPSTNDENAMPQSSVRTAGQ
jgi:RND family efflux transporter MFP subunit